MEQEQNNKKNNNNKYKKNYHKFHKPYYHKPKNRGDENDSESRNKHNKPYYHKPYKRQDKAYINRLQEESEEIRQTEPEIPEYSTANTYGAVQDVCVSIDTDMSSNTEADFTEYSASAGFTPEEPEEEIKDDIFEVIEIKEEAVQEADESGVMYDIIGIRFKAGGKIYYFAPNRIICERGQAVIVETARGLEYGICEIPNRKVNEKDVVLPLRQVIRLATQADIEHQKENLAKLEEAFKVGAEKILQHNLKMKLVDVEMTFDNSKILFYFTAESRVDFRELVKDLASVFKTRIELRQIGIRDETKMLGGIGICGRPFCCKTFLSDFVQVSIKMAKEQSLSLNAVKISGTCGRLMCCLRYEYDTYIEEAKKLPKPDQTVSTPDGVGTVTEIQPLAGSVKVKLNEKSELAGQIKSYKNEEIKLVSQNKHSATN